VAEVVLPVYGNVLYRKKKHFYFSKKKTYVEFSAIFGL